ncbi:hypothetical protein Glove_75g14 [Diversispora epigaea]|uniref:Uncharacterized protein n=1 Tax=Diversispora epigaea TaxID=1348612 RepID=A0A397JB82_9GLOM|nr:hypothetical protein Glove_75g14 [Diversispora epigaea]
MNLEDQIFDSFRDETNNTSRGFGNTNFKIAEMIIKESNTLLEDFDVGLSTKEKTHKSSGIHKTSLDIPLPRSSSRKIIETLKMPEEDNTIAEKLVIKNDADHEDHDDHEMINIVYACYDDYFESDEFSSENEDDNEISANEEFTEESSESEEEIITNSRYFIHDDSTWEDDFPTPFEWPREFNVQDLNGKETITDDNFYLGEKSYSMQSLNVGDLRWDQEYELDSLLIENKELFSWNTKDLGKTDITQHEILTEDASPIKQRPYRHSPKERKFLKEEIDNMLEEEN